MVHGYTSESWKASPSVKGKIVARLLYFEAHQTVNTMVDEAGPLQGENMPPQEIIYGEEDSGRLDAITTRPDRPVSIAGKSKGSL